MSDRSMFYATVIEVSADAGPYALLRVSADGDEFTVRVSNPMGFAGAPVEGSMVCVFCPDGDLGKAWGICEPPPSDRIDGLKPGEVEARNVSKGQSVKLDDSGNVVVTSPSGIVHINPT